MAAKPRQENRVDERGHEDSRFCLTILRQRLAVCRMESAALPPDLPSDEPFYSLTRTRDELSLVCREEVVPDGAMHEGGWRAFRVEGPLPFSLTGVLAALSAPLAEGGISVFAISTYDTDYLMVKEEQLEEAAAFLRQSLVVNEVREE